MSGLPTRPTALHARARRPCRNCASAPHSGHRGGAGKTFDDMKGRALVHARASCWPITFDASPLSNCSESGARACGRTRIAA
jgi:hypothetical protein